MWSIGEVIKEWKIKLDSLQQIKLGYHVRAHKFSQGKPKATYLDDPISGVLRNEISPLRRRYS